MAEEASLAGAGQARRLRQPRLARTGQPWRGVGSFPLGRQLILVVALPLAFLGLLIGLVSSYELRQVALHLVLERDTALAQVAAAGVSQELHGYLEPLDNTARIIEDQAGGPGDQAAALAAARPYLARFDGGILLLNAGGQAIATSPDHPERLGQDYAFRDYFQQVRRTGQPVFSPVLAEQPSGRPAVVLAVPVQRDGELQGVLSGVLFLERHPWPAELAPLSGAGARRVYLVDATGTFIYSPDAAQLGQRLAQPDWQRMVSLGRPDSRLQYSAFLGQLAVISYAPLPGAGWGLILEEPWQAILAAANPWQWVVALLLLAAAILAPVVLFIGVRWVTRSLTGLAQEARQVAAGAEFRPLSVQGPEEVRTLIDVFNRMVSGQQAQQATVRHYAIQVVQSQEEERKRLARELHDETVQQVVGLVQRIELCRSEIVRDPAAARRRLDELQALARQAVAGLRRMSNDLRPLLLEDAGLAVAVQTLCDDLARAVPTARVHCEIVGDPRRLDAERELTAFRIVQEALTNIRKHAAQATHVAVTLYYEDWGLLATVEDDGPGFAVGNVHALMRAGHLGLAGMHERASLIGAEIAITSEPGSGTTVSLRVPAACS